MANLIIIAIIAILVIAGVFNSIKHFKGESGCCGGGGSKVPAKKLTEPKLGEKVVVIEGMHCENCKNGVERAINKIDGAVCKVNLKKKVANISYSSEIDDELITQKIKELGFEVISVTGKR